MTNAAPTPTPAGTFTVEPTPHAATFVIRRGNARAYMATRYAATWGVWVNATGMGWRAFNANGPTGRRVIAAVEAHLAGKE
jgi:hypothetical protein